ncbi:MAG TPA: TonB-dependent receptor, partial [Novosphingobium sp.]|nr:TonB-dependent receptor [Novosphingobium sp.]
LARQTARGDSLYEIESANRNPFLKIRQFQAINTTTWNVSDNLTLKNIMSYGEFRERANFDLGSSFFTVAAVDPSPFPGDTRMGFLATRINPRLTTTGGAPGGLPLFIPAGTPYQRILLDLANPNGANSQQSTFTNELQLQGNSADGKLTYVLGGYIEASRPLGLSSGRTGIFLDCTQPMLLACTNPLFFGSISESATKINFDNNGIYGQATYNFTEQLALTAGLRYTMDKIRGLTQSPRASFARVGDPTAFADPLPGVLTPRQCTDSFRFPQVNIQDQAACITRLTNKSNEPTWLINLDYKPNSDILLYAKYARGYRQGGMNFTNPGLELWEPEQLDSFEVGAKTSFRGAVSGYFNVAGFYNDLKDAQFFAALTPSAAGAAAGVSGGAAIINAGAARSYGVEVDALAVLFNSLRLTAGYTYLNTKVKQVASPADLAPLLVGTPFGTITPRVQKGSPFNDSPKHKLTLGASYTLPLDASVGDISLGATWVYSSKYINDGAVPASINGIGLGVTPSHNLLNLNLDWKSVAGSPIDLAFFATNVTKEKFTVNSTGAWGSAGVGEILMNQPRFYGVRVRFNLGQ